MFFYRLKNVSQRKGIIYQNNNKLGLPAGDTLVSNLNFNECANQMNNQIM